ncbi:FadR/GntR family transcriptional regulator [Sphingosinicella terrae]|uniref:FadR/GntR family transcriptional regulator n=1 Tax=Sphingosinicella terrae TaxID=2172047 RepID=UPI000E0D54CC|nr:FadR/GntR family transcriptional regulator [Sphingosinicella terrae]
MRTPTGRNLTYDLQESLGRAIVGGAYDEGFPTEAELAKTYGLSRSVTREAVKMLSAKGLLSARPRLGTVVEPPDKWNLLDPDVLRWQLQRKFSLDLLRHFSQLRLGIEPTAAAIAAGIGAGEAIAGIEEGFRRMEAAAAGEDDPLEADVQFHIAILHATGNPFFHQFEEMVRTALHTSIQFTNRFVGRSADIAEHGAVLAAIREGDGERAAAAMRKLIADVLSLIDEASAQPEAAAPEPEPRKAVAGR